MKDLPFSSNTNRKTVQRFCVAFYENYQFTYAKSMVQDPICATVKKPRHILHVAVNMAHIVVKRRSIQRIATALW